MSKNLRKLNVTVMRQTAESIKLLAREAGLSEGEVVDRLTLRFTPPDSDWAVEIIMEEISMVLASLPLEEQRNVFHLVSSTMLAMLPPDDWEEAINGARDIRMESLEAYKELTEGERKDMRETWETNLQKRLIHPKLSPEEWADTIWKGEEHYERTVDEDDCNGNE